jgi:CheY-like chemotaxis protein
MDHPPKEQSFTILMADDDEDDRLLIQEAMEEARQINDLRFVEDGVELLQYLRRDSAFAEPGAAPRPHLILLDLNMPRMDGRTALREIKADPSLRQIPVVVLTTSRAQEDILRSYDLGAASFISKPVGFRSLMEMVTVLGQYWTGIVSLPETEKGVA